jgi:cytidylate kinase
MMRRIKDGELDEIRNRDLKDLQRKTSPLQRAEDALSINTAIHNQTETSSIVNRELLRLK